MRPLARQDNDRLQRIMDTFASPRPRAASGGGTAGDDRRIGGYQVEEMSFAKLKAGILAAAEVLTVGTEGAQRVDIIGSTSDGGIKAYDSGNNLTGQWASQSGALWSKSGGFGGTLAAPSWALSANGVIHEDGVNSAGMAPADYPFYAGNTYANRATAPFRVTSAGAVIATSATITGTITASAGAIGGFDIGADYVRDAADSMGLASTVTGGDDVRFWAGGSFANRATTAAWKLFESGVMHLGSSASTYLIADGPNRVIKTSDYSSGVTGWYVGPTYAEFANAYVRGELHSTIFVKGLIEAHAGSMVIAKSGGKLSEDMAVPGAGQWTLNVDNPPGGGYLFSNSDIITVKSEYSGGVAQIWFTVTQDALAGSTQSYNCTYSSGTRSITYPAGAPAIDYGASGQGYLFMTADQTNAPYYDVRTHAGSPWTTETVKVRLGLLTGVNHPVTGNPLTGEYGLWTDNVYLTGVIVSTSGQIGGFDIGSDYLRDAANSFGLASTVTGGDDVRFWAGDTFANRATADFRVTEAGAVTASNITATGGTIGGWTLGATTLASTDITLDSGNNLIRIAASTDGWNAAKFLLGPDPGAATTSGAVTFIAGATPYTRLTSWTNAASVVNGGAWLTLYGNPALASNTAIALTTMLSGAQGDVLQIENGGKAYFANYIYPGSGSMQTTRYISDDATNIVIAAPLSITGTYAQIGTNPSTTGVIRLPNNTAIRFRNAANNANVQALEVNSSNIINIGSDDIVIDTGGNVKIPALAGVGTRNVVVDANGNLSAP